VAGSYWVIFRLRAGYAYVPYGSLESVIEQNKEEYYLALRQTQKTIRTATPNWQPWLSFFLRALQRQMQRLARKVEREKIVLSNLPELSAQIIDHAREHGRATIGEMAKRTGISRNTLKEHFKSLVENGHLAMHGKTRGAWYTLRCDIEGRRCPGPDLNQRPRRQQIFESAASDILAVSCHCITPHGVIANGLPQFTIGRATRRAAARAGGARWKNRGGGPSHPRVGCARDGAAPSLRATPPPLRDREAASLAPA
jgi:hypothetical protein